MKQIIITIGMCLITSIAQAFNIANHQRQENIAKTLDNRSDYYVHIQFIPIEKSQFTQGGVIMDIKNHTITSQDPENPSFLVAPHSKLPQFDIPEPKPGEKYPFDLIVVSAMAQNMPTLPKSGSDAMLLTQELFLQKIYTFGDIFRGLKKVGFAPIVNQAFDRLARVFVVTHRNGEIYLQSLSH